MAELAVRPSSEGWLGGGIFVCGFWPVTDGAPRVEDATLELSWIEGGRFTAEEAPSRLADRDGGVSADNSLWSGDEWIGDADLLLNESPLFPPRDELRGETRPIYEDISESNVQYT
jgi:hypothetical protein